MYRHYGARGITYTKRWKDFNEFHKDMGETYRTGLTLERIDVNGNYEPSNCKWATYKEQSLNKQSTPRVLWNGKVQPLTMVCESLGLDPERTRRRMRDSGWTLEDALFIPVDTRKNSYASGKRKKTL